MKRSDLVTRAVFIVALSVLPAVARAYSDPLSFTDSIDLGGGGGRMFTGSVADGYGCDACHTGGTPPALDILGLPLSGYEPNTAYEVQVEWPATLKRIALALELTDSEGRGAGTLRLPAADELPEAERCEPVADGVMAAMLTELEADRTVLNVPDCGAKRVRFLWTTPQADEGVLRLSGGFLASDGMADVAGDGTNQFARALPPARDPDAATRQVATGCAVSSARPRASAAWLLGAWLLSAALQRRLRVRSRCSKPSAAQARQPEQ